MQVRLTPHAEIKIAAGKFLQVMHVVLTLQHVAVVAVLLPLKGRCCHLVIACRSLLYRRRKPRVKLQQAQGASTSKNCCCWQARDACCRQEKLNELGILLLQT